MNLLPQKGFSFLCSLYWAQRLKLRDTNGMFSLLTWQVTQHTALNHSRGSDYTAKPGLFLETQGNLHPPPQELETIQERISPLHAAYREPAIQSQVNRRKKGPIRYRVSMHLRMHLTKREALILLSGTNTIQQLLPFPD